MDTHEELVCALKALEASVGRGYVPSSALVYLGQENGSDVLARVSKALASLEDRLRVVRNDFDMYRIEGTTYRVFPNRLTNEIHVETRFGKLVLPPRVKLWAVGYF